MKATIILALLCFGALASISSQYNTDYSHIRELWSIWKSQFKPVYKDFATEEYRFGVFMHNYLAIVEFNSNPYRTSEVGLNKFADLTQEEFAEKHTNAYLPHEFEHMFEDQTEEDLSLPTAASSNFDWRDREVVTPVLNEGQCGACWAFSSVQALESLYMIQNNLTVKTFPGPFSIEQVVDCNSNSFGCNGGFPSDAFTYVAKNGIETAAEYPYTGSAGSCQYNSTLAYKNVTSGLGVVNPVKNSQKLKNAVKQRPVVVAVQASSLAFQFYTSGVISDNCGKVIDHTLLVVGYGDAQGSDAFYAQNSWGENWGVNGYVYISTNQTANSGLGVCGILTSGFYGKPYQN